MKKMLAVLLLLIMASVLCGWTGGDDLVQFTDPDDDDSEPVPMAFTGIAKHSAGMDYYVIEYWYDDDADGSSSAGDTQATWTTLLTVEDWTVSSDGALSPAYVEATADFVQTGKYLFRLYAKNLNGVYSSDSSVTTGISKTGDGATWPDNAVIYVTVSSYVP